MVDNDFGSLAGDIARLRSDGVTDDDILSGYKTYSPEDAQDIDALLQEGRTASELVDGLTTYRGRAAPQASEGALQATRKALQYGSAQAAVGLGRTAHWLGEATGIDTAKRAGDAIAEAGRGIAPVNYRPATAEFFRPQERDKGIGGYGWGYLPRMVLEGAPGLVMDIGAGAVAGPGGFMASNAARGFGPAIDARVENNGGREASATDYVVAAGSSALQAYLSKVGLNPALSGVTKGAGLGAVTQLPGQIARAGAVDAASGTAGALVDQAAVTAGTDKGLSIDPHEALGSAVSAGATGGAVRSLRGVGDITNAIRYADMDPAAAQRLAARIERVGVAPDDPESAYRAVKIADHVLVGDSATARRDYDTNVGWQGKRDAGQVMDTAEAILSAGGALTDKHFSDLREVVGQNPMGLRYIETVEDRNALNDLKSKGRFEDGYFAGGLSSSPIVEDGLNPASWLRNPTKRAMGTTAAILGMGSELEAARALMAPAAAAKVLGLQAAAYGGVRALDGITGSRNPVREFTGRFGGDGDAFNSVRVPSASTIHRAITHAEDLQLQEVVRKAAGAPTEAVGEHQLGKGRSEGPKAASESPRGSSENIDSKRLRIEVGPYVVERPREGIANVSAYVTKTRTRMEARASFGDELENAAGGHKVITQGLVHQLNTKAKIFKEAASMIEDAINDLPWDKRSQAWDVFAKHEARLRGTY